MVTLKLSNVRNYVTAMGEQLVERGRHLLLPGPHNIHTVCILCTPILQNEFNLSSDTALLVLGSAGDGVRLRLRARARSKAKHRRGERSTPAATASDRLRVVEASGPVTFTDGSPQRPARRPALPPQPLASTPPLWHRKSPPWRLSFLSSFLISSFPF